jgi:hypothetical protein
LSIEQSFTPAVNLAGYSFEAIYHQNDNGLDHLATKLGLVATLHGAKVR